MSWSEKKRATNKYAHSSRISHSLDISKSFYGRDALLLHPSSRRKEFDHFLPVSLLRFESPKADFVRITSQDSKVLFDTIQQWQAAMVKRFFEVTD